MYFDYSVLKPYLELKGQSAQIKKAQALLKRKAELERAERELRDEFEKIVDGLESATREAAIVQFSKELGIVAGKMYMVTPKMAGKSLDVLVTRIGLSYRNQPYALCALLRRDGSIRETKELYPSGWDFTPIQPKTTVKTK